MLFGSHGLYNLIPIFQVIYGVNNTLLTVKGIITVYAQSQRRNLRNQGSFQLTYSSLSIGTPCGQLPLYSRWFTTQPEKYAKPDTSSGSSCFQFSVGKTSTSVQWRGLSPWRAAAPGPPALCHMGWHLPVRDLLWLQIPSVPPVTAYSNIVQSLPSFSTTPKGQISPCIDKYKTRWQLWTSDFL